MFHYMVNVFKVPAIASVIALGAAPAADAGDGNTIFIAQDTAGDHGNTLFVDQSLAANSRVSGPVASGPAVQSGGGNEADIFFGEGIGAQVLFSQVNTNPDAGLNLAAIQAGSLASVMLTQQGFGNTGALDIAPGGNSGTLSQIGNENDGTVSVAGTDSAGILNQQGNRNTYHLDVVGQGAMVTWNQIGNANSVDMPASVMTNAGTVTVTQFGN